MAKPMKVIAAIKGNDWKTALEEVSKILDDKITQAIAEEKQDVAAGLLVPRLAEGFRRGEKVVLSKSSAFGGYKSTRPNGSRATVHTGAIGQYVRQIDSTWSVVWFPDFYDSTEVKTADLTSAGSTYLGEAPIEVGDRIRTKRMGQTPGTVVKVENGNVYFELDEPEGKFGKRIWAAPLSNVVKEEAIAQYEVQRVYNEVGDIGETELLCGVRDLRVNPQGQVISYVCEDRWKAPAHIPRPKPCGKDCLKGDDHDPDYYCGEGKPWKDHQFNESYIKEDLEQDSVFASDLGLRPGQWPQTITYKGVQYTRSAHGPTKDRDGDIVSYIYGIYGNVPAGHTRTLEVYND
jgi:hypothetical protein